MAVSKKNVVKPTKRAVPAILPREPLTKKAKMAIWAYVNARGKGTLYAIQGVAWTLEAERMRRATLYEWLEAKGYVWQPRYGIWESPSPALKKTANKETKTK